MSRSVTVRAIIYRQNKLFCFKHFSSQDGQPHNYWSIPGGHVEDQESLLYALKRELIEETNVEPSIGPLLYVHQYIKRSTEQLEFFFLVNSAADFENIDLAKTTHGAQEIAEFGYKNPSEVNLLPKFLKETDLAADIESGRAKFFSYL